jgi:hypothetical protein
MDTPRQFKVNKGEWSEVYVFCKILNEREVSAADSSLETRVGDTYKFLKLYRADESGLRQEYDLETDGIIKIIDKSGRAIKTVSSDGLSSKTQRIFQAIKNAKSSSFEIEEASSLMHELLISQAKAGSLEKSDIIAEVSDKIGRGSHELGFSIKSHVGGAPTLVNSSSHTNFAYEIVGFNGGIDEINSIEGRSKVRDRLTSIYASGGYLNFSGITSQTFTSNLKYADMLFPEILAEMLLSYFLNNGPKTKDLIQSVLSTEKFDITEEQLTYKVMDFLRSSALGMVPSRPWSTKLDTYGGYIVVLADGGLVCYHLFNDDDFKEYLVSQTKFDTPSTTKYDFGNIYLQDGKPMINLNLQIRFLK